MRVYNRAKFMQLPSGTLYSKGKCWYFTGFNIKGETTKHNDFYERCLLWPDSDGSYEDIEKLENSLDHETSFTMNTAEGRDGCYDDDDIFLVFEKADLEELERIISNARMVI